MSDNSSTIAWSSLSNPFRISSEEIITGHVSGRQTDITEIIMGGQSAIILSGAPGIGKSALLRYLQGPVDTEWTWRNEVSDLRSQVPLEKMHFTQIDLSSLEDKNTLGEQLEAFVKGCIIALQQVNPMARQISPADANSRSLRKLFRQITQETPDARYFVILDAIDRLGRPDISSFNLQEGNLSPQDKGLAALDACKAIRILVDMIDEFPTFGVILSIKSLPRPNVGYQFSHVSPNLSYDLARFKTITLQTFTWEDAKAFLAQPPESFGINWAKKFKASSGTCIFSKAEQEWLLEQAGTSPYLLQQFCFHAFRFKHLSGAWIELQERDKKQIIERTNEQLSTFFVNTWQRLQEALERCNSETKNNFAKFVNSLEQIISAEQVVDLSFWDQLEPELRYILYSEGIVRYDPRRQVHYPGSSLRHYLMQKVHENKEWFASQNVPLTLGRGFWITISRPHHQVERMSLSELEYLLLKTLKQNPKRCKEEILMKGAWGEIIARTAFTQRMFHLRKRLRDQCEGSEIIENHYGGEYSLNYPEWFQLE